MAFKAVIFDFDGLMIDSEVIALRLWQELAAELGGEMSSELNRRLIGKAPAVGAQIVRDELALDIAPELLRQTYWEKRTTQMCLEARPVAGLEPLITTLLQTEVRLGVASNSPTDYVDRVLQAIQLRGHFECVLGSDQVEQGKPAPDVYLAVARILETEPEMCLAIEDSPTGVAAAVAAGMTCYAVPNRDLLNQDFGQAQAVFESLINLHTSLI